MPGCLKAWWLVRYAKPSCKVSLTYPTSERSFQSLSSGRYRG